MLYQAFFNLYLERRKIILKKNTFAKVFFNMCKQINASTLKLPEDREDWDKAPIHYMATVTQHD
jgi:hypothetical protein